LYRLLNRLHELGVLEKLIPAFHRARGLLQFNEYHKYTVDEHCIRSVRQATEFAQDAGPLGRVYRAIRDKQILHLALLLHDLGKGYAEDHCKIGRQLAMETAAHLHLAPHETEILEFLVHKHLLMTHLALWRDIDDPEVVLNLAVEVGSPEVLRMLYVLSAADLASVGTSVLNDWKVELLTQLFERTIECLSSDDPVTSDHKALAQRRRAVADCLADEPDQAWYAEHIEALPSAFLRGTSPASIAHALVQLHGLQPGDAVAWGTCHDDHGVVELTVGTHESITRGIFHKLTGAIADEGLEILSAQINTFGHGLVLDRFHVTDPNAAGALQDADIGRISQRLVDTLKSGKTPEPTFRAKWRRADSDAASLVPPPTRVIYDNATSERATIFDIFAPDRSGLLFTIARTLYKLDLSVTAAKIGTHLDQVVDVFYVTDMEGEKIQSESRLEQIRERLLEAVKQIESADPTT
jgi:[protein-PII] uridylyltransferase